MRARSASEPAVIDSAVVMPPPSRPDFPDSSEPDAEPFAPPA